MTDLEAQLAKLEQRLAAMEAREEREPRGLVGLWREVFPPEARKHMRTARKEQLLAVRAFLDPRTGSRTAVASFIARAEISISGT